MNLVRAAGTYPAAPFLSNLRNARAGLFACGGVLAALNAQSGQLLNDFTFQNSLVGLASLAGISGIIWFALYAALSIGLGSEGDDVRPLDCAVLALAVALSVVPFATAAKAALELCAVYLLFSSGKRSASRRVGIILLGLTGPLVWGRLLLEGFAMPLLSLDAHLAGAAIGSRVQGNIVQFAHSQKQFLVGIPCSSVHNISLAIVLWTTGAALFKIRFDGRYVAWGLSMIALMFGLNIARLSLIGLYPSSFVFLHDGVGADLFGWAGLLGAGTLAFLGVKGAVARQK